MNVSSIGAGPGGALPMAALPAGKPPRNTFVQRETKTAAESIAEHLQARRTSPGRWVARCPAHADRAPSLSIAQGNEGRALLHCHAGCSLPSILQSAGLRMGQLFTAGPPPQPEQLAARDRLQARRRAEYAACRRAERLRTEQLRLQWHEAHDSAGRLARLLMTLADDAPDAAALTLCFHALMTELRLIDSALTGEPLWL